jgi:hypothetical protein
VAPVLVLLSYVIGPAPMDLQFWPGATSPADRFVCPPDPPPTRSHVAQQFVAWVKSRPQLMNEGAIDTLFRYAAEAFPCSR